MKKKIECIYGAAGSGKSYRITKKILASLKSGKRVFLIVPEQEVLIAERRIADAADAASPRISCEELTVASFRRLANIAFRTYGGLSYSGPTDGARSVIMWQVTEELSPLFKEYKKNRDRSFPELMLSACDEAKRSGLSPLDLEKAAEKLPDGDALRGKLSDLALIMSGYNAMLSGSYADPNDDVARLGELLSKHRFFDESDVFIDSFNGFTEAEYSVIDHIIRQSDLVSVALCMPSSVPHCGFETVRKTLDRLRHICERADIPEEAVIAIQTERSEKYYPEVFIKLERAMRYQGTVIADKDKPSKKRLPKFSKAPIIQTARPTDDFSEAEYAATRILQLIESGARYRDIAIVGRGIDRFNGILDTTLTAFDIPFFMSVRRPVSLTPLFRAIIRALSVIDSGWRYEEVISYLKTGMTELTEDQITELEEYAALWNITGAQWTSDIDWSMNPDGYNDRLSKRGAELLERLNAMRPMLTHPLIRLSEALAPSGKAPACLRDGCAAIYGFLNDSGITEHIRGFGTAEDTTIYNTLMDMLDMLVHVGGDIPINARVLHGIITMAADKTDYGALPQKADSVTIGDAALLRAGSVKHVIMLGCIDGVFPRSVADDGFFSDTEKNKLSDIGIKTLQNTESMADDELFYFYRAASAASHTLTVSCPLQNSDGGEYQPSLGFLRLEKFVQYCGCKTVIYPHELPLTQRAYSTANAPELYREYYGSAVCAALKKAINNAGIGEKIEGNHSISEPEASVSPETARMLFGNKISLSPSRFECFENCHFKYYSTYTLNLATPKKSEFSSADIGNFIHRILECAVKELFDVNGLKKNVREIDITEQIDKTVSVVVRGMLGNNAVFTARTAALISRLKRTANLLVLSLIDEFEKCAFVPTFFELGIDEKGSVPPFKVPLDDQCCIYVNGKIDRVDTYKKGNDVYVRIVDYKTGSKNHSFKKIEKGIDIQMLLYLFAIWKAKRSELPGILAAKDGDNGKIIPAGVIYRHASYPTVKSDIPPESTTEAIDAGLKKLDCAGLILTEEDVIPLMGGASGGHLPITSKKDGTTKVNADSRLCSIDDLENLVKTISDILTKTGNALRSGTACASPRRSEKPCEYCDYRAFCRSAIS